MSLLPGSSSEISAMSLEKEWLGSLSSFPVEMAPFFGWVVRNSGIFSQTLQESGWQNIRD